MGHGEARQRLAAVLAAASGKTVADVLRAVFD
jgi:hypothetical protein